METSDDSSNLLLDLAGGKYDHEVAKVQRLLRLLGKIWPPARLASLALSAFMAVNKWTAPVGGAVTDGHGGFVPKSNSRVHPANGRFIKWTPDGWVYDDFVGGKVKENFPPPA